MKKVRSAALVCLLVFASHANAIGLTERLPKTGLACDLNNSTTQTILRWLTPDATGLVTTEIPTTLTGVVTTPIVQDEDDYWLVAVAAHNVFLRGHKVDRIERWSGKQNGINGFALVFAESYQHLAKTLKSAQDEAHVLSTQRAEINEKQGTHQAMLVCDFSD